MAVLALLAFWLMTDDPIALDRNGQQGVVTFDHAAHVKATALAASCGGCHHTRDGRGVIQLMKCESCHGPLGDPRNPKSQTFNEENRKTAYHEKCIGCHANLAKANNARTGPVACADCHQTGPRGKS